MRKRKNRSRLRRVVAAIATTLGAWVVKEAFDRHYIGVPDWGVGVVGAIAIILWLSLFWSHAEVKKHRQLVYTRAYMSLGIFIATGAILGGIAWVITRVVTKRPAPNRIELSVYPPFEPAYKHNKKALGASGPEEMEQPVRQAYHAEHEHAIALWLEGDKEAGGGGTIYVLNRDSNWTGVNDPGVGGKENYWRDDERVIQKLREKFGERGIPPHDLSPPYGPVAKAWYESPKDWREWIGWRTPWHCHYQNFAVHIQRFPNGLIIGPVRWGNEDLLRLFILTYTNDQRIDGKWKQEDDLMSNPPKCDPPPTK